MIQPFSLRNTPIEETAIEEESPAAYSDEALLLAAEEELSYDVLSTHTKAVLLELAAIKGVDGLTMSNLKDDIINAILAEVQ